MRVLVGGVGYRNLRDHSFGVKVADALSGRSWPDSVSVEDLSYGPIAVVQRLEDEPANRRFDRAIVVSAVERPGRPAGTVTTYRWNGALPGPEQIQAAVAEAVTGVISMDNTLVVARYFRALPSEVIVVELQPATSEYGDDLSAAAAAAFEPACAFVARAAEDPAAARRIPELPLGGGAPRPPATFGPVISNART